MDFGAGTTAGLAFVCGMTALWFWWQAIPEMARARVTFGSRVQGATSASEFGPWLQPIKIRHSLLPLIIRYVLPVVVFSVILGIPYVILDPPDPKGVGVVLALGIVAGGGLIARDNRKGRAVVVDDEVRGTPTAPREFAGILKLPSQIHHGDARNVSLILHRRRSSADETGTPLRIEKNENGTSIVVRPCEKDQAAKFLEVELSASGFKVKPEKMEQSLASETLAFHYNCYFPNSGDHQMWIILRAVSPSDRVELGRIQETIRVVRVDNLTVRHVWLIGTILTLMSASIAYWRALAILLA